MVYDSTRHLLKQVTESEAFFNQVSDSTKQELVRILLGFVFLYCPAEILGRILDDG